MSIRKMIDNYKKELKNKLLIIPGDKIRKECRTYECPMYILMVTFNNNQIDTLPSKVVCTSKMCDKIKTNLFECSLSENVCSVFSGFFVDDEFFSYESILSKDCLPTLQPLLENNDKSEVSNAQQKPKKLDPIETKETPTCFKTIEEVRDSLIKDLDTFLGKKQVKSYTRIKDDFLIFTNPIETDLSRINKKIQIDLNNLDYKEILEDLKIFYMGIIKLIKITTCDGCSFMEDKKAGFSIACSTCSRNEEVALLKDIPKQDNFQQKGS